MAKTTLKLVELMRTGSIRIYDGMEIVVPQLNRTDEIHLGGSDKPTGAYSIRNGSVAFCWDGDLYVCPDTASNVTVLREAGFERRYFDVPLSNGEYPAREAKKWQELLNKAGEEDSREYEMMCRRFCNQRGIMPIPREELSLCLEVPKTGILVKHPYYSDVVYPMLLGKHFGKREQDLLGRYSVIGDFLAYVHVDGKTYVTRRGFEAELKHFGYRRDHFCVPFSNGEKIVDPVLAERWEELLKRELEWELMCSNASKNDRG